MTDTLDVGAFGAAVHVRLDGLTTDEQNTLREQWKRCIPSRTLRSAQLTAAVSESPPHIPADVVAPDAKVLAHRLSSRITLSLIDLVRDELLLLHACAVADTATGAVVALIGPSGRGKTTAALTLGKDFGYVTDETVAIGWNRAVFPYPKPLSIIQPDSTVKAQRSPDELGLLDIETSPHLSLEAIVLLDRRDDVPGDPKLQALDLADAIADLIPQISYLSERERPLIHLADTVAQVGGIRRLSYRDATQLAPTMRALLAGKTEDTRAPQKQWLAAPINSLATTGVRRSLVSDALDDGQRLIVLKDRIVRVLDGIAPAIWRAADGVTLAHLTSVVIDEHGTPPDGDAEQRVRAAITELRQIGLLREEESESP